MKDYPEGTAIGIKSKGFIPSMIRLFTATKYNHWAIITINQEGNKVLSEAVEKGIVYSDYNTYDNTKKYKIIARQPIFDYSIEKIRKEAFQHEGDEYDFEDLLIEQPFFIITGWWIGGKTKDTNEWICVKWVMYCLWEASGRKYFKDWYKDNNKELMGDFLTTI